MNYDIAASRVMPVGEQESVHMNGMTELMPEQTGAGKLLLFTTKTCPNCRIAKEFLKSTEYEVVDAEERLDLVNEYGIMQAPTLIVLKDGEIRKFVNASGIKGFVEGMGN